jgi:signal transduction histidine kinase
VLNRFGLLRWGKRLFTLFGILYGGLFPLFFVMDRHLILECATFLGLLASVFGLPLTVAAFCRQRPATWLIGAILFFALALALRWFLTVHTLVPPVESLANLLFFRIFFAMGFATSTLWLIDRERKSRFQALIMNEAMARQRAESESQRRESQERFMTMLMHELKTPLAIIQLAASSLGRQLVHDTGVATRVRNINRSVDDLNALVERCASADQLDEGSMRIEKQSLCLATLVGDVLQTVGAGRIELLGPAQHAVFSDVQYVRLILLNLLSNALKYSPPESPVQLHFETTALKGMPGVTLRITNAVGAAGIPDAAQVFTRYYRAEGARRQVGAGLGLWLGQALTRQLGSELQFQAGEGQVCFSFFLESA